jgi:cell division protein FtsI (penicillin-binding protein 3)
MLEGVVKHGTATNLRNPNYTVAGKTGTALVADGRLGYRNKIYRSSFIGYFPADKPKYTCMVMVNGPSKGIYYGALVAGPVFKEIADKVYASSTKLHPELRFTYSTDSFTVPAIRLARKNDVRELCNRLGISAHMQSDSGDEDGNDWVRAVPAKKYISLRKQKVQPSQVPDVKGMGVRDAVYLLENAGLKVYLEGAGKVKSQSLLPGQRISKGMQISLKLG